MTGTMPRTAVIALSRHGAALARRLSAGLGSETALYLDRRFPGTDQSAPEVEAQIFDLPLRPVLRSVWNDFGEVVLFLPVGAAVRLVAPLLNDKRTDPALVCVDDSGRFAVSVVSGHLGGADDLAERVARALGAEAVITSGSHATNTIAVDLLGREFGWTIEADSTTVTRASAAVVNREPVGVYQEAGEPGWWPGHLALPDNIMWHESLDALAGSGCTAALIIADEKDPFVKLGTSLAQATQGKHVILYRPRSLVAGMGCRRGVPADELEQLLVDTFQANNLSLDGLGCIATATLKQDEPGLLALAAKYRASFRCYDADELNGVFEQRAVVSSVSAGGANGCSSMESGENGTCNALHPSANARRLVGVWGVAEPAAMLASGASRLLVAKQKVARATLAVARREFPPDPDQTG